MDTNPFKHTVSDDRSDDEHADGHVEAVGPAPPERTGSHVEPAAPSPAAPTLSETLAILVAVLPAPAWSTLRWSHWRASAKGYGVEVPSGKLIVLGERQRAALGHVVQWTAARVGRAPQPMDWILSVGLPGRSGFMETRWIRAVIAAGDVTFERYALVRERFEAELAAGAPDRAAWGRAREGLRGGSVRDPTRTRRGSGLGWVPVELGPAVEQLADRLGLAPATARNYRSVLRRIFERSGGRVPDDSNVGRVLDYVARRWPYCAEAPSMWRALARSATWDGITLPLPPK